MSGSHVLDQRPGILTRCTTLHGIPLERQQRYPGTFLTTRDEVNQILKAASETERLKGILDYTDEPLVSIDLMHSSASSTIDSLETAVIDGKLVRVVSWYDNEWGFSNRMIDTACAMARLG